MSEEKSTEVSVSAAQEPGIPEEEFASVMNSIDSFAPLLRGIFGKGPSGKRSGACAGREALLIALKPYLSPARCAAVDYLVRIGRITDAIRTLQ